MPLAFDLPASRAVRVEDPLAALAALSRLPYPFLIHSSLEDDRGRWSFFGADPFAVHRGERYDEALESYRRLARRVRAEEPMPSAVPFTGGVVGYWAYDFGRRLETIPAIARDDLGLPDFVLGFYDVVGAFEHRTRQAWLFSSGLPLDGEAQAGHAEVRLDKFSWLLETQRGLLAAIEPAASGLHAVSTFHPDDYRRAIETLKEHIRRGDLYQANLSQRWTVTVADARPGVVAHALHEALARCSPAPFAFYFSAGDHAVASASPERFLELRGRQVETRPIKGTRPRGTDPGQDEALKAELLASAKDRAENVMIVDVLRNDLGRACELGSVTASALCELETFPQVFHLTSTVSGVLREGLDAFDLLHACFPGGSITGAPKIRAMEILEALEPVRRHLYTGSLGYVDWRGDADWNIAIRTALVTRDAVHFAAGGGITADSDPDAEFQETLHKAEGLRVALGETLGPVTLEAGAVHA